MASVLDLGLIDQFSSLFAILFVFLVVYAILQVTNLLGQNPGVHGLIALLIALMSATQPSALKVVSNFTPFFMIFLIMLVFLFLAATFAGFKPDEVLMVIGGKPGAAIWFVIITIILLFFVLSGVYGQSLLDKGGTTRPGTTVVGPDGNTTMTGGPTGTGSFAENFGNTFFHPKILGLILIMMVGAFAIAMLTGGPKI